jgi:hypothetical protein
MKQKTNKKKERKKKQKQKQKRKRKGKNENGLGPYPTKVPGRHRPCRCIGTRSVPPFGAKFDELWNTLAQRP